MKTTTPAVPSEVNTKQNHADVTGKISATEEGSTSNDTNSKQTAEGSGSCHLQANEKLVRDDSRKKYDEMANKEVYEQLKAVDPVSARNIHPNNRRKLIR